MDLYELWRARVEGRFGLRHYLFAWIVSARLFALPWVVLLTLFGALLAGISSLERALASCLVVALVTLASHFNNNYKDIELGIDRYVDSPEEAERLCSTIKPYTAAAWIVPLRITGIGFQKANEYAFVALAVATYLLFFAGDPRTLISSLPILILGLILAETYTTAFKRARLGEVAAFLGHGFGTTAFGYLSQAPDISMALVAGIPTGLLSAIAYSVDQFVDIKTDFVERVRSVYESWFNSGMPLGLYVIISMALWYNVLVAWIAIGVYPRGTILALLSMPPILFMAPQLEYDRRRALLRLVLVSVILIPSLMCLGALIR